IGLTKTLKFEDITPTNKIVLADHCSDNMLCFERNESIKHPIAYLMSEKTLFEPICQIIEKNKHKIKFVPEKFCKTVSTEYSPESDNLTFEDTTGKQYQSSLLIGAFINLNRVIKNSS
ncbi:MAG: hypothetical protein MHPSP_002644, partial [Paramarteilia canceri]